MILLGCEAHPGSLTLIMACVVLTEARATFIGARIVPKDVTLAEACISSSLAHVF